MTSSMLSGDRRWASSRRSGMTVLGKVAVPKPINLPSQRLEKHGLYPNVKIVPKGTPGWGSRPSSSASNAWSSSLSPNTDGGTSSPSHLSGRPSSGGSGTRNSTAGSDRALVPSTSGWGSNSRPSSASWALPTTHSALASLRPNSAEARPVSSQLSRFAEPLIESSGAWNASRTTEKLGVAQLKNADFSLSSGDFPTLGTEKDKPSEVQDHISHSHPGSSFRLGREINETVGDDVSVNANMKGGTVNSWRRESQAHNDDGVRPSMEKWQGNSQPDPNAGFPPQHFDGWHGPPVNNPQSCVCFGGPRSGPPFGNSVPPSGLPIEPFPYYRPHMPPTALANPPLVPPPGTGPGHHKNGDVFMPHMPEAYIRPGIPIRPGFYPGSVAYDRYYSPPRGYCNSNERDAPFMGMTSGPPVHNRYSNQNRPEPGSSQGRSGGYSNAGEQLASKQVESSHPPDTSGPYRVLLEQHESDGKNEPTNWEDSESINASYVDAKDRPRMTVRENEQRSNNRKNEMDLRTSTHGEEVSSQTSENQVFSSYFMVRAKVPESSGIVKKSDEISARKLDGVDSDLLIIPPRQSASKDASLVQKIEGLNAIARDNSPARIKEEQRNKFPNAPVNRVENKVGADVLPARIHATEVINPAYREIGVSGAEKNLESPSFSGTATSRRIAHGMQGRGDHRNKGRFNNQDTDGWRKNSLVEDSSASSGALLEVSNVLAGDHCISVNQARHDGESAQTKSDPAESHAQRAKMIELAKQRTKQLQEEEEERSRKQKAKALAKLEELNRRAQAVDESSQKEDGTSSSSQNKQEEIQPSESATATGKSRVVSVNCDANTVSQINDTCANKVEKSPILSTEPHLESLKNSGKEPVLDHSQSMTLHQDVNSANGITLQVHSNIASKQKPMSYKQKPNLPTEKTQNEKVVSTTSTAPKVEKETVVHVSLSPGIAANEVGSASGYSLPVNSPAAVESSVNLKKKDNRNNKDRQRVEETSSLDVPKEANRRWASSRRSGMTVLGKVAVPKPINLPSQRLENHGLDPNVEIVLKGALSLGSKSSSASNAWGSSLSPNTDGGTSSPSHLSGRPSSRGSGTRPSTAGSDRALEPSTNAWGSNSRPSSASGALPTTHSSLASLRPHSAEARPGSSQLSRFAEPLIENSGAWNAARTTEKLGVAQLKNADFSLSSGDFPTLGTEKDKPSEVQDHISHSHPGSSFRLGREINETVGDDVSVNANMKGGTVNSWRRESQAHNDDGVRPSMEKWQGNSQPDPNAGFPPQHFDGWHGPPVNNPQSCVCFGGPRSGPPFGNSVPPSGLPIEPFPYYRPHMPPTALANPPLVPPPGTGPGHHKNGDVFMPHMPEAYIRPGIPIRPGFYPGSVAYDRYYSPPRGYCNSNERDAPFMGMTSGPPVHNRYSNQNRPEPGSSQGRSGGYSNAGEQLASQQVESSHPPDTSGPYRVLLEQHESDGKNEPTNWEDSESINASYVDAKDRPRMTVRENEQRSNNRKNEMDLRTSTHGEEVSSQTSENQVFSSSFMVRAKVPESSGIVKKSDEISARKLDGVASDLLIIPPRQSASKDASLVQKIEGLNAIARDNSPARIKEEERNKFPNAPVNRVENKVGADVLPARIHATEVITPAYREIGVSGAEKNLESPSFSGTATSWRIAHGMQGRGDHRNKGRFNNQDTDGWRKNSLVEDSSASSGALLEVSNVLAGDHCISVNQARHDVESARTKSDPAESHAQRAKMIELAKQRTKQLQEEEEERSRKQKAKALAKLEELNRRAQAVDESSQKEDGTSSSSQNKQEEIQPSESATATGKSRVVSVNCDANTVSQINDTCANKVEKSPILSTEPHLESLENSGKEPVLDHNQSMTLHQDVNSANAITLQVHSNITSKQKPMSYKQKQNLPSEKTQNEKVVSTTSTAPKVEKETVVHVSLSSGIAANEVGSASGYSLPVNSPAAVESSVNLKKKDNRNNKDRQRVEETSSLDVPKEANRRWVSSRRSGMTVLGKVAVPKPINLPSQRLENHGLDPNVEIVLKGALSLGSRSSSASNAWGSSLSPNTDGGTSSPSHLSGRPSSSGSGTRPSTAGSDRALEPSTNAWGSNSRPSSASGALPTTHSSIASLRPHSAETRPGSSQLSRFAEPLIENSGAWNAARTTEKLGDAQLKNVDFSLSSGDFFPTLGTEKDKPSEVQDHISHVRPVSSSGLGRVINETVGDDVSLNANLKEDTVDSWRRDSQAHNDDDVYMPHMPEAYIGPGFPIILGCYPGSVAYEGYYSPPTRYCNSNERDAPFMGMASGPPVHNGYSNQNRPEPGNLQGRSGGYSNAGEQLASQQVESSHLPDTSGPYRVLLEQHESGGKNEPTNWEDSESINASYVDAKDRPRMTARENEQRSNNRKNEMDLRTSAHGEEVSSQTSENQVFSSSVIVRAKVPESSGIVKKTDEISARKLDGVASDLLKIPPRQSAPKDASLVQKIEGLNARARDNSSTRIKEEQRNKFPTGNAPVNRVENKVGADVLPTRIHVTEGINPAHREIGVSGAENNLESSSFSGTATSRRIAHGMQGSGDHRNKGRLNNQDTGGWRKNSLVEDSSASLGALLEVSTFLVGDHCISVNQARHVGESAKTRSDPAESHAQVHSNIASKQKPMTNKQKQNLPSEKMQIEKVVSTTSTALKVEKETVVHVSLSSGIAANEVGSASGYSLPVNSPAAVESSVNLRKKNNRNNKNRQRVDETSSLDAPQLAIPKEANLSKSSVESGKSKAAQFELDQGLLQPAPLSTEAHQFSEQHRYLANEDSRARTNGQWKSQHSRKTPRNIQPNRPTEKSHGSDAVMWAPVKPHNKTEVMDESNVKSKIVAVNPVKSDQQVHNSKNKNAEIEKYISKPVAKEMAQQGSIQPEASSISQAHTYNSVERIDSGSQAPQSAQHTNFVFGRVGSGVESKNKDGRHTKQGKPHGSWRQRNQTGSTNVHDIQDGLDYDSNTEPNVQRPTEHHDDQKSEIKSVKGKTMHFNDSNDLDVSNNPETRDSATLVSVPVIKDHSTTAGRGRRVPFRGHKGVAGMNHDVDHKKNTGDTDKIETRFSSSDHGQQDVGAATKENRGGGERLMSQWQPKSQASNNYRGNRPNDQNVSSVVVGAGNKDSSTCDGESLQAGRGKSSNAHHDQSVSEKSKAGEAPHFGNQDAKREKKNAPPKRRPHSPNLVTGSSMEQAPTSTDLSHEQHPPSSGFDRNGNHNRFGRGHESRVDWKSHPQDNRRHNQPTNRERQGSNLQYEYHPVGPYDDSKLDNFDQPKDGNLGGGRFRERGHTHSRRNGGKPSWTPGW